MAAFAHVVVGFDGSTSAHHALRWAIDRVHDESHLEVVCGDGFTGDLPADCAHLQLHRSDSAAAPALLAAADQLRSDAIIIGPHGSGLGRGLGGVARRLLREATVPVVVVEDDEPPRSLGLTPPVVACVGYGEPATAAAHWAADFATERSLPLVLLHAVAYRPVFPIDSASDVLASYLGAGVSAEWALDELSSLAEDVQARYPDLAISTHVDCTSVIKAVQHAGQTAELVVLGKRSNEEFLHTIGTPRLRRLVARSRFPTAVVPTTNPR